MSTCGHPICALIGDGACSIAAGRSRGCRPNLVAKTAEPGVVDDVRALLAALPSRDAAVLLALVRDEEPELAPELARLLARR
jgi:hypothetical protein